MTLLGVVDQLKVTTGWATYDYAWLERELATIGLLAEATGNRIHAVVIAAHETNGETTYCDFSPCEHPCGYHGLPPEPIGHARPCITFLAQMVNQQVLYRDETVPSTTADA
jgi:hypothetical protein